MNVRINKSLPLGVKEQIKRQIRSLIRQGDLASGQLLPSARDMAQVLGVNRNTVAAAYRDLAAEGFVASGVGSGTFVQNKCTISDQSRLREIFNDSFSKARSEGYELQEIIDYLSGCVVALSARFNDKLVLVIECNREALEDIATSLESELEVKTKGAIIQDIEADPDHFAPVIAQADLIVCGFNHLHEVQTALPNINVEVVAVMLKPSMRIMNDLMRLPPGSKVGFSCVNTRSTQAFFKNFIFMAESGQTVFTAGLDDDAGLTAMLKDSDAIYATHYAFDRLSKISGDANIVKVDLGIDQSNIAVVREALLNNRYC